MHFPSDEEKVNRSTLGGGLPGISPFPIVFAQSEKVNAIDGGFKVSKLLIEMSKLVIANRYQMTPAVAHNK